jgi:ABC-2 type transport system permease protein
MMNIIKSEFYKLKKSKLFYICMLACALIPAIMVIAIQAGVQTRGAEGMSAIVEDISGAAFLAEILGLALLPTVLAVFVSIFVSGEFHNGTMKHYVSKGFNRVQIYLSKLAVSGAAVLAIYFVHAAISLALGTALWGFDPSGAAAVSGVVTMVLGEGLLLLAYSSIFVLVSMLLRSNGAAIAVTVCATSVLPAILMTFDFMLIDVISVSNFWISGNVSALAAIAPESGAVLRGVIVGLCYIAGGTTVGSILFRKQDIK